MGNSTLRTTLHSFMLLMIPGFKLVSPAALSKKVLKHSKKRGSLSMSSWVLEATLVGQPAALNILTLRERPQHCCNEPQGGHVAHAIKRRTMKVLLKRICSTTCCGTKHKSEQEEEVGWRNGWVSPSESRAYFLGLRRKKRQINHFIILY